MPCLQRLQTRQRNEAASIWKIQSGVLPDTLDETALKAKALNIVRHKKNATNGWNEQQFNESLQANLNHLDDTFFEQQDYLRSFQGKDLAAAIETAMQQHAKKPFKMKGFYKYALRHFDYTRHPDLVEFRELLKAKNDA